jgi:hypothetical protein
MHVYRTHFLLQEFTLQNRCEAYARNIMSFLKSEPATPVLYVVKLSVEVDSVWDCYLASWCTHANVPTYYRCIGISWLHDSSRHHWFPRSQKTMTSPTNYRKCFQWQPKCRECNHKYFTFTSAACIRVIIFKFLTWKSRCGLYTHAPYTRANTLLLIIFGKIKFTT